MSLIHELRALESFYKSFDDEDRLFILKNVLKIVTHKIKKIEDKKKLTKVK